VRAGLAALLFVASAAQAQAPACESPEHHQFDFWIGDWIVTTPDGRRAGTNIVTPILGGCAVAESWRGTSGIEGHSYNAYDLQKKLWHQTWVDSQGTLLSLEGGLENGAMVLSGPQGKALSRITWTPEADGTVTQLWQSSEDRGKTWQTVFHGIYARRALLQPPVPRDPP
jgi:hypothetical protein